MFSLNKSGDARRTQKPAAIMAISLLLAAIPTIRWYALRLQDGGGELAGLVPLCAALWFAVRDWKGLASTSRGVWAGIVLMLVQAALYPFLPAMIRALLMMATLAAVSGIWRKPGISCLLILALPWTASLDFFLGYPLRLLTSINARFLLEMTGTDVSRAGVQLFHEGRVIGVDPACSGLNMLWSTGLLTALLAAMFCLRWRSLVVLGAAALVIALAGNSLRAAILFYPEAGLINMPQILHPGIGLAIAGGCFSFLMKLARILSATGAPALACMSSNRATTNSLLPAAALLVLLASCFSEKEIHQPMPEPPALASYQGVPITRIPLNATEEAFYRNFPGTIAVYEAEGFKLIVRQVNRATRKLHPASHCLRAEGFGIGSKTVVEDEGGSRWLSYNVTRNGAKYQVRERVTCTSSHESWPEISAWYWHAFFHPADGPWEAVTVINAVRP